MSRHRFFIMRFSIMRFSILRFSILRFPTSRTALHSRSCEGGPHTTCSNTTTTACGGGGPSRLNRDSTCDDVVIGRAAIPPDVAGRSQPSRPGTPNGTFAHIGPPALAQRAGRTTKGTYWATDDHFVRRSDCSGRTRHLVQWRQTLIDPSHVLGARGRSPP